MHQDHLQALKKKILDGVSTPSNIIPTDSNTLLLILEELKNISNKLDNMKPSIIYVDENVNKQSKNISKKNEKLFIPDINTANSKSSIKEQSKTDSIDISSALDMMDDIGN